MSTEIDLLADRIAEQAAHISAATHRLLMDIRDFDVRGGWHVQGAESCAHWLTWRIGWNLVTARDRVRVARRLGEFAAIDDALRRGELSYSKVRAILRIATPANEPSLIETARHATGEELEKLARKYAAVQAQASGATPRDDIARRYVRRRDTHDGMVKIEAVLPPDEAELIWAALDHRAKQLLAEPSVPSVPSVSSASPPPSGAEAEPPARDAIRTSQDDSAESPPEQPTAPSPSTGHQREDADRRAFNRADALVSLTQAYLRGDHPARAPIDVVVTIPLDDLRARTQDPTAIGYMGNTCVSTDTARRLSCDAGVVEIIEDEHGTPLSVGRKRRTIAGSIKRALLKRDTTCSFPGCTHRLYLEGHHIQHWADGGKTSLDNCLLLCSFHHKFVHEYGYQLQLDDRQRPEFRDMQGRLLPAAPALPRPPDLGWPRIHADNASLDITADTRTCLWSGKPMPYANVVDHLARVDYRPQPRVGLA